MATEKEIGVSAGKCDPHGLGRSPSPGIKNGARYIHRVGRREVYTVVAVAGVASERDRRKSRPVPRPAGRKEGGGGSSIV